MPTILETIVFPHNCSGCGEALTKKFSKNDWEYLCDDCAKQVRRAGELACEICGVPLYGIISGRRLCSVCRDYPPPWGKSKCLLRYSGPAKGWIKNYKYRDARYVEREWTKLLQSPDYSFLKDWLADAILVPIPLHPLKKIIRGFNQSESFAKLVLKTLQPPGAVLNAKILKRVRWTAQQARLSREKRLKNMKGAFAVDKSRISPALKEKRVILVDDLLTTGATLAAGVQTLKKSGFIKVDILTIARA